MNLRVCEHLSESWLSNLNLKLWKVEGAGVPGNWKLATLAIYESSENSSTERAPLESLGKSRIALTESLAVNWCRYHRSLR